MGRIVWFSITTDFPMVFLFSSWSPWSLYHFSKTSLLSFLTMHFFFFFYLLLFFESPRTMPPFWMALFVLHNSKWLREIISNHSMLKEISPGCSLEGLMLRLKLQYFGYLMRRVSTHWKRPWCWEGLGAGGEGDDRGWDGWMASPTWCIWVWVNSGSWWWTGRPGVRRFMGSQRIGHNWATELNWRELMLSHTFIVNESPNGNIWGQINSVLRSRSILYTVGSLPAPWPLPTRCQ